MKEIVMTRVGIVRNGVLVKKDDSWGGDVSTIVLDEPYAAGLMGLGDFSHAIILFHLN